mgnify:CR=1 FL=1
MVVQQRMLVTNSSYNNRFSAECKIYFFDRKCPDQRLDARPSSKNRIEILQLLSLSLLLCFIIPFFVIHIEDLVGCVSK